MLGPPSRQLRVRVQEEQPLAGGSGGPGVHLAPAASRRPQKPNVRPPLETLQSRVGAAVHHDYLDRQLRRELIYQAFDLVSVGQNGDNDRDVRVHNEEAGSRQRAAGTDNILGVTASCRLPAAS